VKAAVLYGKGDIRYADWPESETGHGQIKVRVHVCGICGSDIPRIWGDAAHFYPVVLGHEFAGEVTQVGEGVTGFAPGDRVAGVPLLPCMECDDCSQGRYASCKKYSFIGSRQQGALAEYVVIPARNAVKLPEGVTYEMGTFFEPASVALHGLMRAGFRGGADTAVIGAGNIGMLTMEWARIFGAKNIAVFDILDERLAIAKRLGADTVVNTRNEGFIEDIRSGYGYVFETAGHPDAIRLGFDLVSAGGTYTCIGTPSAPVTFEWKLWEQMNRKEFYMTGTWMSYSAPFPGREWRLTAHYFGTGALRMDEDMVFARFPLEKVAEAAALFQEPGHVKGKVLITND
jgi:L-iditol 2-dehydrogenase